MFFYIARFTTHVYDPYYIFTTFTRNTYAEYNYNSQNIVMAIGTPARRTSVNNFYMYILNCRT